MIAFDAAMALVAAQARDPATKTLPLADAAGRVLAEDLLAPVDAPLHPLAMMDGYAVRLEDVLAGGPLAIAATSRAGAGWAGPLGPGQAARIFTGAQVPQGADCVIMQEYAEVEEAGVWFREGHGPARHIRAAASDFRRGDVLLARGTRLTPRALVAAAAADTAQVRVARPPRVAVLTIGDELAAPGSTGAQPDRIPDTLSAALVAAVRAWGGEIVSRHMLADDPASAQAAATAALGEADLVVIAGGASVGEHDLARSMFAAHATQSLFARVAIKPGRPVWLSRAGDRLVLGLPGNPTSALVTARLFLQPLLAGLQGARGGHCWRLVPLAAPLAATGQRESFARARWETGGLIPLESQLSGAQAALADADCLIRCPPGQAELAPGTLVPMLDF